MRSESLPSMLLLAGVLLIAASLFVPRMLQGKLTWSDDLAKKYQAASQNYHSALHARGIADARSDALEDEAAGSLESAGREFAELQTRLSSAQAGDRLVAVLLRWIGVLACGAGCALYVVRQFATGKKA